MISEQNQAFAAATPVAFDRIASDGGRQAIERTLAEEIAVAIEYDGVGYAVLMASPVDLIDLAYGFTLTERLIDGAGGIVDVEQHDAARGIILRVALHPALRDRVRARVRHRTSDASCGLCGIENLDQAMRPLPLVPAWTGTSAAVFAAARALDAHQPLNRATGSMHAAARCTRDGAILSVREDVGRHNALDKLVGWAATEGVSGGFVLVTSRISFEMVDKALVAGAPMLVGISAATTLAVEHAREHGLTLVALARPGAVLVMNDPGGRLCDGGLPEATR